MAHPRSRFRRSGRYELPGRKSGCLDDDERYAERKVFDAASSRAAIAPSFGLLSGLEKRAGDSAEPETMHTSDSQSEPGLVGTWFGGSDLSNPKEQLILTEMDHNWMRDGNRGRAWSARWRGYIEVPYAGEVTFTMRVSTGGILQIDGREIISQWREEGTSSGTMQMVKGKRYPIILSYRRNEGHSYLRVCWSWPGRESHVMPGNALSHGPAELRLAESESGNNDVPPGRHWIGFRVVQVSLPSTKPSPCRTSYAREGIRANAGIVKIGPAGDRPYFRKRYLLPVPLDNSSNEEIDAVGTHPSFRRHNHSPALEVCPNGDVLMVIYTSYEEYEPGVSLIASRLRFGADEWDMPDRMFDFAAANDHAPLLWTDGSVIHFFWGSPPIDGGFPFQWTSSKDSGATLGRGEIPGVLE